MWIFESALADRQCSAMGQVNWTFHVEDLKIFSDCGHGGVEVLG